MTLLGFVLVFLAGCAVGFVVASVLRTPCPDPPQPPPRPAGTYTFDEMMDALIREADKHLHDIDRRSPFSPSRKQSRTSTHTTNAKGTKNDQP